MMFNIDDRATIINQAFEIGNAAESGGWKQAMLGMRLDLMAFAFSKEDHTHEITLHYVWLVDHAGHPTGEGNRAFMIRTNTAQWYDVSDDMPIEHLFTLSLDELLAHFAVTPEEECTKLEAAFDRILGEDDV